MTTRTDVHSPASIIPADYTFLFGYAHPSSVDGWPIPGYNLELIQATRTGKPVQGFRDSSLTINPILRKFPQTTRSSTADGTPITFAAIHKNGACDVCGAWHIEGSVFYHVPTGEAIALGWQCAEKLELDWDDSERQLIAGNRKAARQSAVAKAKRFAFLRDFVDTAKDIDATLLADLRVDHHIVRDIRSRIIRGYEPSTKQLDLVRKLAADTRKPAEKHVRAPVEDNRQRVTGKVVGVKIHDGAYGSSLKITVKIETPDGSWLTWGTAPSALLSLVQDLGGLRGATVAFDAKLVRADDSEHFTFFKRPTKPEVLAVDSDEARKRLASYDEAIRYEQDYPSDAPSAAKWLADEIVKRDILRGLLG
jgi:hypothetical protein